MKINFSIVLVATLLFACKPKTEKNNLGHSPKFKRSACQNGTRKYWPGIGNHSNHWYRTQ